MANFADQMVAKTREVGPLVVGFDPHFSLLPPFLLEKWLGRERTLENLALCVRDFNGTLLEALSGVVGFIKLQMAFYEALGIAGMMVLKETIDEAKRRGFLVILDGKRNDIASSAEAYACGYLSGISMSKEWYFPSFWDVDALTVNPYFGRDGLLPFAEEAQKKGKGIFILARTSNPSASFIQDEGEKEKVFVKVVHLAWELGEGFLGTQGWGSVGVVVGATYPEDVRLLRTMFPRLPFLLPGIGTQQGSLKAVTFGLGEGGLGVLVNVSRDILFAYRETEDREGYAFAEKAKEKALFYREQLKECTEEWKRSFAESNG